MTSDAEVVRTQLDRLRLDLVVASRLSEVQRDWFRPPQPDPYSRLTLVLEGDILLTIDGQELTPQRGELVYLPAEHPISYATLGGDRARMHWLHFSAMVGERDLGEILELPYVVPSKDLAEAVALFERVAAIDREPPALSTPVRMRAALSDLFGHFLESAPPGAVRPVRSPGDTLTTRIIEFIGDRLDQMFTLEELAAEFDLSPADFGRHFKATFGLSPKQYVKRAKVEHAQRALLASDRPIEEIATEVGMDQAYFSKVFRQICSVTPTDYRRLYRGI